MLATQRVLVVVGIGTAQTRLSSSGLPDFCSKVSQLSPLFGGKILLRGSVRVVGLGRAWWFLQPSVLVGWVGGLFAPDIWKPELVENAKVSPPRFDSFQLSCLGVSHKLIVE